MAEVGFRESYVQHLAGPDAMVVGQHQSEAAFADLGLMLFAAAAISA